MGNETCKDENISNNETCKDGEPGEAIERNQEKIRQIQANRSKEIKEKGMKTGPFDTERPFDKIKEKG